MKTRSLVLFLLMILAALPASATHYMGGEISWECLPNGNFRFIMKVYRECYYGTGSAAQYGNPESLTGPFGNITMYLYPNVAEGIKDMSPSCHPQSGPHYACGMPPSANMGPNLGAIQECTYTSDQVYPNGLTLSGVPPQSGWTFYWDGCCRNSAANYTGQPNWYISAKMYPYNGWNTNPCFDNSPRFHSVPPTSLPIGYPFSFNLQVQDKEMDSLSFAFTPSLTGGSQVSYINPYSATNPFPGPTLNPQNVPALIDPVTGEFTFTSFTQGAFITAIKASSYRNGVLIAEVTREIQVALQPNSIINYPLSTMVPNYPPEISIQTQGTGSSIISDTIWAGEYLEYDITAIDTLPPLLLAPGGTPNGMTFYAAGADFGYGFTNDTAGCPYPPCATLDPAPDSINTLPNFLVLNSKFRWLTDCSHSGWINGKSQKTHVFSFSAADKACPVPASNGYTYTVTVKDPVLDPPHLHSPIGGNQFMFAWSPPDTTQMPNHFNGYFIYLALVQGGPFVLIDSLSAYTDTTYTYAPPYVNGTQYVAFFVRTRSGCSGLVFSLDSDTLEDIIVDVAEPTEVGEQRPAFHQDIATGELRFRVNTAGTYALEVRNLHGQRIWSCPARHYASGDHAVDWPSGTPARGLYIASALSPLTTVHSKVLLQ